ncbi:MAG: Lrp/AsnC ligand binding domain-containing protein [Ornithinimicrobium sp.]
MVHAYILVQTEVGKSSVVASAIAALPGVSHAEDVTGPYDVIARVEAESVNDLGRLVIAKIQEVPHITRTTTCTVVNFAR